MDRVTFAATGELDGNTLAGTVHVFGTRTTVGNRYVEFAPGAFDAALARADVRAFWNHDTTLLLGRQSAGTLRLDVTAERLGYSIDLPATSYAEDMKALVARGDLSEMSFGIIPGEVVTDKAPDGRTIVRHTSVRDIFDISPVSLPAFTDTSAELHSGEESEGARGAAPTGREGLAPGAAPHHRRPKGDKVRTIPEIMAAMDAATDDAETFSALETELAEAQATDVRRARMAELRKPIVDGTPAVIRATPKGDAGLDFAFEQYLRTGQANSDIAQLYAQTVGSTTGGGYTVPQGFLDKLTEGRSAYGGFMNLADSITTTTGVPLEWPSIIAAVSTEADIAAEGAASAAGADLVFGTVTLGAYKYASTGTGNVPLKVSIELLQDSQFDVAAFVARRLGERIARKQAYDLVRANGSGAPLGIMDGTAGDVATASGSVPTYAKLKDLLHALDPAYREGASFIMNDTTLAVLEGITDAVLGRPMLMEYGQGMGDAPSAGRLLGKPVIIDQAIANGANNVQFIGFGNWREAYIVRHVLDVQVLVNPYGTVGYVQYDAWARMDGTVQNAAAYVTMEGTT